MERHDTGSSTALDKRRRAKLLGAALMAIALSLPVAQLEAAGAKMTFGAWFAEFHDDFATFQRYHRSYDSISLFYYGVQKDGTVAQTRPAVHRGIIKWAQARGVKVFATIGGTPPTLPGGYSGENGARCIQNIVRLCREEGYDGFDIDFEGMNNEGRAAFNEFVAGLAQALKDLDPPRLLSVTVQDFPCAQDEASMAFDYEFLGRHADCVRVMCYDYSYAKPGPIMPREWFANVLDFSRSRIPAEKFIAALPWYGRDWTPDDEKHQDIVYGQRDIQTGLAGYLELIMKFKVKPAWDSEAGEYHFDYTQDGRAHTVWMPEHRKFSWMVDEVRKRGAAGIYVWHAAYPDPKSWKVLQSKLKAPRPGPFSPDLEVASLGRDGKTVSYTNTLGGEITGDIDAGTRDAGQLVVSALLPSYVELKLFLEEGSARGGDGEIYACPSVRGTGEWEEYVFALPALLKSESPDSRQGDGRFEIGDIKSWSARIPPGQGDGEAKIRAVKFGLIPLK